MFLWMKNPMEFLPLLREIVRSYQAFDNYSAPHIKSMDLTPSQFDVIATLGNQPPMACKTLGDKTLITKGTLTGILDRLEIKGLTERKACEEDARSQKVALTLAGQAMFEHTFPKHMQHLEKAFKELSPQQMLDLTSSLKQLREAMEALAKP
jgi:MarR family transcriptional regulator, 2-MHQ and catechol-resistance regulon repressor